MKSEMSFQIELDGVGDNSIWSIVFFQLSEGNIGIEIRNKGRVMGCSPKGEKPEDMFAMVNCLKYGK